MIESAMYVGIGFLFATLGTLIFIPLIHRRAVRLTVRRMENVLPKSMAEVQAEKDLLRADFAVAIRRLEMSVDELKERNAAQRAELGKKDDALNRFRIDREALNVEVLMLKAEAGALRAQCGPLARPPKTAQQQDQTVEATTVVEYRPQFVDAATTARLVRDPDHDDRVLLPKIYPVSGSILELSAIERQDDVPPVRSRPVNGSSGRTFAETSEPPDDFSRKGASSIHVSPDDHFIHGKLPGRFGLKAFSLLAAAVLTGVGLYAWDLAGGDTKGKVAALTTAITAPPIAPARTAASQPAGEQKPQPELAQQVDTLTHEVADMRNSVQQLASAQPALKPDSTPGQVQSPPRAEPEAREARLTPAPQAEARATPAPETPPTTIPGWIVRAADGGTATVQGPRGTWRVARGDNLPDLGRVVSIVHWGNRWIVATHAGLISTR